MNKSKKYGKGDLYDQRKLIPKIMNYLHCDREKAKEVFNKLKEDANKEIPDFNKYINKKIKTKKSTSKKKVGDFVIFLAGLVFFIIGWIKFFEVPYGFTFDRTMSFLTIIMGGFLLKIIYL